MVTTSCSCGTFSTTSSSAVSRDAHRIGRAAFLAPEILISPSSGTPPRIFSLSMGTVDVAGSPRKTTGRVMRSGRVPAGLGNKVKHGSAPSARSARCGLRRRVGAGLEATAKRR